MATPPAPPPLDLSTLSEPDAYQLMRKGTLSEQAYQSVVFRDRPGGAVAVAARAAPIVQPPPQVSAAPGVFDQSSAWSADGPPPAGPMANPNSDPRWTPEAATVDEHQKAADEEAAEKAAADKATKEKNLADSVSATETASGSAATAAAPAPAPQQVVNVPAQDISKVSPRVAGMIGRGEDVQMGGIEEQERAEAAQANDALDAQQAAAEDMRVRQLLDEQDRQAQRESLDTHLAQIQARSDAVAAKKVNPTEYIDNLSAGQKILGVIGMALSGALEGFTGRPNSGDTLILKGINDSIDAQKSNLENERHGLDNDKDLYARKLELFGDDQKAKAAVRQEAIAASLQQIEAIKAKYNSPIIAARADQLSGQLLQQFGHDQATLETYVPAHQMVVGGTGDAGQVSDIKPETVIDLPNGQSVSIADTAQRQKVDAALSSARDTKAAADKLEAMWAKPALERMSPGWQKEYMATAKVFTAAGMEGDGGKGGVGKFKIFNAPVDPTWRGLIAVKGTIAAARDIANARVVAAEEQLRRSHPTAVRSIQYRDPSNKKGVVEQRFINLGLYTGAASGGEKDDKLAVQKSLVTPVGGDTSAPSAPDTLGAKGTIAPIPTVNRPKAPAGAAGGGRVGRGSSAGGGYVPKEAPAAAPTFNLPARR